MVDEVSIQKTGSRTAKYGNPSLSFSSFHQPSEIVKPMIAQMPWNLRLSIILHISIIILQSRRNTRFGYFFANMRNLKEYPQLSKSILSRKVGIPRNEGSG